MPNNSYKKSGSLLCLLSLFISTSFNIQATFAAGFSDINEATKNYEAILYLQENSIINGYPDGTFKPYKAVNRAEFLKIIIEGSDIATDITTPTPFKDVDNTGWYAPYVKKAFAEGWINGYPDGTFKPAQTINKVEALKILGKAQDWPVNDVHPDSYHGLYEDIDIFAWYTPYVAYAKINGYLEETGSAFSPETLMSRGGISETIYLTLTVATNTSTDSSPDFSTASETDTSAPVEPTPIIPTPKPETDPEPDPSFTPVNFSSISTTSYDNITLSETLPNIFYKNEIYIIKGDINSGTYDKATVIFDTDDQKIHNSFIGQVENNHFEIPIHFNKSGNYLLGLIPGESGQSKAYSVSILSGTVNATNITTSAPQPITSFNINYAKDKTSVTFEADTNTFKKIIFTQNDNTVTYLYRQDSKTMPIRYGDFENFMEGEVSYRMETAALSSQKPLTISSDFAVSTNKTFTAVEHSFDEINKNEISTTVADTMSSPSTITINGTVKIDTKTDAFAIRPNGSVDKVTLTTSGSTGEYFSTPIITSGSNFTFTYTPETTGRYIIEINNKNSEASLNHPIYIGNIIPLIPDYFDIHTRELFKGTFDLTAQRQEMLNLINQDRAKNGLNPVVLADELNSLAQAHSDDMKNNNFFSHYNLSNQTPDDRRIAKGIKTPVSENIAKDVSVTFAHYGFMRSAGHRKNILTPEWARLGLGISLSDGNLTIVQEFSTNELTATDFNNYRTELLNGINSKRASNNLSQLGSASQLETAAKSLNDKTIISEAEITNSDFTNALQNNNIFGSSQLIGRNGNPWKTILDSLLTEEAAFLQSMWKLIGIDIQTDKNGQIHAIIIVNDND